MIFKSIEERFCCVLWWYDIVDIRSILASQGHHHKIQQNPFSQPFYIKSAFNGAFTIVNWSEPP